MSLGHTILEFLFGPPPKKLSVKRPALAPAPVNQNGGSHGGTTQSQQPRQAKPKP